MEKRSVGAELRKLSNLLAREASRLSKDMPGEHVTEMHVNIIDFLLEAGEEGVMQKDIEKAFTIRKSTASRILTLMEKKGIIERHGVAYDARLKRIILTPGAIEHHIKMTAYAKAFERRLIEGIPEGELTVFFDVLEQMQRKLEG